MVVVQPEPVGQFVGDRVADQVGQIVPVTCAGFQGPSEQHEAVAGVCAPRHPTGGDDRAERRFLTVASRVAWRDVRHGQFEAGEVRPQPWWQAPDRLVDQPVEPRGRWDPEPVDRTASSVRP